MTIYHKLNCSTLRNVLGLTHDSGEDPPQIIEYLKLPPGRRIAPTAQQDKNQ